MRLGTVVDMCWGELTGCFQQHHPKSMSRKRGTSLFRPGPLGNCCPYWKEIDGVFHGLVNDVTRLSYG